MSPLRPCLGIDGVCPARRLVQDRRRCPDCERDYERARPARPTSATRTSAERARRAEAVAEHRARYGQWCPGYADRPAHAVLPPNDLTADHVVPVARGGAQSGPLVVRCRACNGAKRDVPESPFGPTATTPQIPVSHCEHC